jgi:hypothetical protein
LPDSGGRWDSEVEGVGMKLRIAIWALVGALAVALWSIYMMATRGTPLGNLSILLDLTCPIALARHYRMSVYFVGLVNAGTYALIGGFVEIMRGSYKNAACNP